MTTTKPRDSIARKREATKAKRSMASFHQMQQSSSSSSSSFLHLPHDRLAFPFSQHLIEQEPVHDPALDSVGSRCAGCTTLSSPRRLDQRKEGRKEGGRGGPKAKMLKFQRASCVQRRGCGGKDRQRKGGGESGGGTWEGQAWVHQAAGRSETCSSLHALYASASALIFASRVVLAFSNRKL